MPEAVHDAATSEALESTMVPMDAAPPPPPRPSLESPLADFEVEPAPVVPVRTATLFILALIALGFFGFTVWQGSNAPQEMTFTNPEVQLENVRSQIELFRVRNEGQDPAFSHLSSFAAAGLVTEGYLTKEPVNFLTGNSTIALGTPPATAAKQGDPGWYWDGITMHYTGFNEEQICCYE